MSTRYVALGPLLSGEGSRAFLGLRISDGEAHPCALIWVPERVMQEPELVEQLRRDTSRAAGLEHPNVMRVYGLIEVDEGLARVTEFADGESLRRLLDVARRLPAPLAARVLVDAARGVQYAHMAANEDGTPLLHGDLRPETLLVSYHGVTKVTGYGALNVAPREMGGKRVMGRRLHCAPEQILGGRSAVTEQTDVYLLGLILYEVLTGEIPFSGEKDFDKAVLSKNPPLLSSELVPPKLRNVIGKAMAKKGNLRFQTVQAFREAIEEAMGDIPAHAELGAFVEKAFEGDDTRAARRRELDAGIQEYVVKKGLKLVLPPPPPPPPPPAPPEAPPPPPEGEVAAEPVAAPPDAPGEPAAEAPSVEVSPELTAELREEGGPAAPSSVPAGEPAPAAVPAAPAPALAAAAAVAAPTSPRRASAPPPEPRPSPAAGTASAGPAPSSPPAVAPSRRSISPWVVAVPLAAAAAAYWFGRNSTPEKIDYQKLAAAVAAASADASAPRGTASRPAADPTASPPAPGRPRPGRGDRAAEVGGADEVEPGPGPALTPLKPARPRLDVTVDPPVNVSIDGRAVGRTPLNVEVSLGKHRVTLSDPAKGIQVVRAVSIKPGINRLSLSLGKGSVTLNAPAGCEVRIDGKLVGKTPLPGPVEVYEGTHKIQVSVEGARWQQAFSLNQGERMNFEVETHSGEE